MMKRVLTVCFVFGACVALSSCSNTMSGIGADIERAGESIQRTF